MYKDKPFELSNSSGHISLDFINTANFHGHVNHQEWLQSELDVIEWANFIGLSVESNTRSTLSLTELIQLREAMYRITFHAVNQTIADKEDMRVLNKWIKKAQEQVEILLRQDGVFSKQLTMSDGLTKVAFTVVLSFSELIMSDLFQKVKQCNSDRCEWFFIDHTKNKSKQWCTMKICGNREKAKRFYQSSRKEKGRI
ncbi:CGNR zinc finger domain-containing protein [Alkalicoccobacillus plakortidis]|uniref:CGNR zinc finger domain-containing protein n=1 Tax=Alkalicoccobacillus plakortidis TaxID=444060 RepID=A0ABT0XLX4_9BACI|nr:CGNR zinc finger domain-containing protein [Alkalicoccobacillus plakortidis]MCM2676720.1 CGNR zinc finger domain-containing protein [Alkalicoccobacillus plakortidis]